MSAHYYYYFLSSAEDIFIDFLEIEEGGERETSISCLPYTPQLGIKLVT